MSKNWSIIGIATTTVGGILLAQLTFGGISWIVEGTYKTGAAFEELFSITTLWLLLMRREESPNTGSPSCGITDNAVKWFRDTERIAFSGYQKLAFATIFPFFIIGLVGFLVGNVVLLRRLPAFTVEFVILSMLAIILFPAFIIQFKADQEYTETDSDRAAAHEALNFVHQEQLAKPWYRRAVWVLPEVAMRAKRLGIRIEKELTNEIGHIRPR
ncbi:MAG: hypothetical protein K8R88_07135 [Armatimonadetes bacterium]|nr:hypothetical protein [Armatimonadota bacterium]